MKNIKESLFVFKTIIAIVGGYIGKLLGGNDGLLKFLIGLVILDYIVGIIKAIMLDQLSSKIGFKGIMKKILLFVPIGIAFQLDIQFNTDMMLRYTAITFYIVNESISIIENLAECGVPVPEKVIKVLKQLDEESE